MAMGRNIMARVVSVVDRGKGVSEAVSGEIGSRFTLRFSFAKLILVESF
jgi:hypothetical protein